MLQITICFKRSYLDTFIVNGATGCPSAFDQLAAFKAKLTLHSIDNPKEDALSCLICHFPQQMLMLAQAGAPSDDAMLLYSQALPLSRFQSALIGMVMDL